LAKYLSELDQDAPTEPLNDAAAALAQLIDNKNNEVREETKEAQKSVARRKKEKKMEKTFFLLSPHICRSV
jgi:uncharacterized coiled-coil DUF342 family protein